MPENDFEKQVQRLFDEMRIKPSEKVWPQIETKVKKDKNRRRFFLWLPAALVVLVAGGYWLTQPVANSEPPVAIATPVKNDDTKANESNVIAHGNDEAQAVSNNTAKSKSTELAPQPPGNKPETDLSVRSPTTQTINDKALPKQSNINVFSKEKQIVPSSTPDKAKNNDQAQLATIKTQSENPVLLEATGSLKQPIPIVNNNTNVEGVLQKVAIRTPTLLIEKSVTSSGWVNKPAVQLPKPKHWEWGVTGGAGISAMGESKLNNVFGLQSDFTQEVANNIQFDARSSSYYNQQLAPQTNALYAVAPPESIVKRDFSWYAGAFVKRKLNDRLSLSTGLQYHQYTTNRMVGDVNYQYDVNNQFNVVALSNATKSSVARYSGAYIGGKKYTNKFHLIELPIGIDWLVNKNGSVPLYINAGLQFSYLLNTNALHYDSKAGVYYEDKTYFRKFQTGLYAGIATRVFAKKPYAFNVGPTVSYNINNMFKTDMGTNQNLMFAGVNIQWIMGNR